VVLVAAAAGAGVVVFGPRPDVVAAQPTPAAALTATTAAVDAPTLPIPSIPQPSLPQPSPPPSDPHADVPVVAIGELAIPAIGLDTTVYEGIWETVIDVGPGHWPGTAEPGAWGNTVLAGHRVSHGHPFRAIDQLVPGDSIVVRTADGTFTYSVTGSRVVTPAELSIVDQHPGHTITLFACHPPGSAQYRYVVTGELVASEAA
jgi:sortase A